MIVGFASTAGGCLYYRCELPARVLPLRPELDGLEIVVGSELYMNPPQHGCPIGVEVDGAEVIPDVLVLAGAWPALGFSHIEAAQRSGQRIVCDVDDWWTLPTDHPVYQPGQTGRKLSALRAANAVTCSTPYLRDALVHLEIPATLIRNSIDPDRYRLEHYENIGRRDRVFTELDESDELVIGYRGLLNGFHDADVRELHGAFGGLERVRFVHIGEDPRSEFSFAELAGVDPALVDERPATEFRTFGPQLAGIDIAVIPLAPREISRAKSAIAALEWHAAGVPWLATDHPEFALAGLGHGLIRHRHQWGLHLELLRTAEARAELYEAQAGPIAPPGEQWTKVLLSVIDPPA